MKKCEFCDREATRTTIFYSSEEMEGNKESKRHVCREHYLEFEHGLVTVDCDSCKLPTLLDDDYYYHLEQIFCAHCGHLMENKEWVLHLKSDTSM